MDTLESQVSSGMRKRNGEKGEDAIQPSVSNTPADDPQLGVIDKSLEAGELSLEEDAAGGMGRHLGVFSTTLLM